MVSSNATTVTAYLDELPAERRAEIAIVRDLVNAALPDGYREAMGFGMIGWVVPLDDYPNTYNGQPLAYAGLAAHKNSNSLYLTCLYASPERSARFAAAWAGGKKLSMGKSCIRFKAVSDLDLELIRAEIAAISVADFIAGYERVKPPVR